MLSVAACHHAERAAAPAVIPEAGRHHDDVEAQIQPYLDGEIVSGIVVGLYDAGKVETYGFGKGPNHAPPDATTLFELGPATKVYTAILFADAVQRQEVALETPVADLLPPGVTMPTKNNVEITLRQLAVHASGLPRIPPSISAKGPTADPFGGYGEDALYRDLVRTELAVVPNTTVLYSDYATGLLGFLLGKKLGGGYAKLVADRIAKPLELRDTFVGTPPGLAARRATGTNDDLAPVAAWTYDALAGAGGIVTSARDQLKLIDAELDAVVGSTAPLRRAMKLTQEPVLDRTGDNEGFGWNIDAAGRYWHNGNTGGFHGFLGFDPKTKRGVVILASTATSLLDRLGDTMYKVLDGQPPPPVKFATAAQLAPLVGNYAIGDTKIAVVADKNRLYLEGQGEPRHRLVPISDHEMWIEVLGTVAIFQKEGDKVARVVFGVGDHTLTANRVDAK
ncbi:MAG TPA: serine hydrolase domain-containing protein [Kofleriaceae bacterium]|nr:serine hydrolase domain-containing protein [Kofleriaceae bacterium]